MKPEVIALQETYKSFQVQPDQLLRKNKSLTQDERIARASLFWVTRQGLGWTYEQISKAYGVSLTLAYREEQWLSSFIESMYTLELRIKLTQIALNIKEKAHES